MSTTSSTAIRLALRARLLTVASLPPVAYEFQPFTPTNGVLYLREAMLRSASAVQPVSTGPVPWLRIRGLYQLSVYAPFLAANASTGTVTRTSEQWADTIAATFAPGLALTFGGRRVVIETASVAAPIAAPPDWVQTPVTIAWMCDVTSLLT